jgi:hypothetical protein
LYPLLVNTKENALPSFGKDPVDPNGLDNVKRLEVMEHNDSVCESVVAPMKQAPSDKVIEFGI